MVIDGRQCLVAMDNRQQGWIVTDCRKWWYMVDCGGVVGKCGELFVWQGDWQ